MTRQWAFKLAVQETVGISPGAIALGKELADAKGPALLWDTPTQGELARRMRRSRRSVVRWWRELRDAGLITYRLEAFRRAGQWRRRIARLELWTRSEHCATPAHQKTPNWEVFSRGQGGSAPRALPPLGRYSETFIDRRYLPDATGRDDRGYRI